MPRFLCCHKSTPERILGGRIAESWHRADECGGRAKGHMRQRQRAEAMRPVARTNGGAGLSASRSGRTESRSALNRAFPSRRRTRKEERCRANRRDASLPIFVFADVPRRQLRATCSRLLAVSRLVAAFSSRLALRRNQRSSEMRRRCSQIGEPRCAVFAPCSMAGLNRAGNRLNARLPSVLADEILFDQKSVTDRRSTRPNAPVGSVPAGDIAVRATRCSIFRASNRPWAQVK